MDIKDIQIFCDLCRTHSITKTSEYLFLTQSAVTRRIQKLEEELGVPLLTREKGRAGVRFTEQGEKFLPLAEQWLALNEEAQSLRHMSARTRLAFGGIDSVTCYLLSDFFEEYLAENRTVDLNLYTYNSWDVYTRLESGEIDVGVTHTHSTGAKAREPILEAVEVEPLFEEPYVLLRPRGTGQGEGSVLPAELELNREVYAEFDQGLRKWHLKTWPNGQPRMYAMGSISLILPQMLSRPESWCIVPVSVAKVLCQRYPLTWSVIPGKIPKRFCCVGVGRNMEKHKRQAAEQFVRRMREYLEKSPLLREK